MLQQWKRVESFSNACSQLSLLTEMLIFKWTFWRSHVQSKIQNCTRVICFVIYKYNEKLKIALLLVEKGVLRYILSQNFNVSNSDIILLKIKLHSDSVIDFKIFVIT